MSTPLALGRLRLYMPTVEASAPTEKTNELQDASSQRAFDVRAPVNNFAQLITFVAQKSDNTITPVYLDWESPGNGTAGE